MLLECGARSKEQFEKIQQLATSTGKGSFSYAFLVNHLKEERERGISISGFHSTIFNTTLFEKRLMSMLYFVKGLVTLSASSTLQVKAHTTYCATAQTLTLSLSHALTLATHLTYN